LADADALVGISSDFLAWAHHNAGTTGNLLDTVIPLSYSPSPPENANSNQALEALEASGVDLSGRSRIVWYLGSFNRLTDLEPVIAAAASIDKLGRDEIQFVFSGSGENESRYRELAKGLSNVVFTGWVDRQVADAMSLHADLGLAPYIPAKTSAMGNKYSQYLSSGIPVLTFDAGEAGQFLEANACGEVYRRELESLDDQLVRLLLDEEALLMMGANAKKSYARKLTPQAMFDSFEELFGEMLKSRA